MNGLAARPKTVAASVMTAVLSAALTLVMLTGCARDASISQLETVPENEPDQTFIDARIVVTGDGITSAIVAAESISAYLDTGFTDVEGGVTIDFFDSGGDRTSTLTADRGEVWGLYDEVDSLIARGDVRVISADSTKTMETASAFTWSAASRQIYADGLVRLTTEDAVEEGVNFVATDDLSEYRMDEVSGEYGGSGLSLPDR